MTYKDNRAQNNGSPTCTSAPMTELNGRRRTKSGETLEQGDVDSKSAIMSRRNVSRWDYVLDRAPSLPMSHVSCQILPFIIPLVCL